MALAKRVAIAVLSLTAMPLAHAADSDSFRSPSSNIYCTYDGDGASLRCDIVQTSNRQPPRPRDCDLAWGRAFEISRRSTSGIRICHGDTIADPNVPVLPYGSAWSRGDFTCHSAESGVLCRNGRGAGFELSRARQRLF